MPTRSRFTLQPRAIIAIALPLMMLIATPSARAQLPPVIGSPNTATADPVIPRPPSSGDACVVTLFDGLRFTDYASKPIDYRPPLGCEGPWSRIVFEGDFAVSAGRQFDRTANVWLGGVNVYFGTTAEPSRTVSRSWHVERDLTELAPLFMGAQAGEVDLGNTVDATYTGILTGSARVVFYPRAHRGHGEKRASQTAPTPADLVVPMSARPTGGTVALSTSASTLARSIVLPQNVERAYLDVIVQSQASDEFWYTCVPSDVSARLQSCGGTSFREAEITVDGTPAGVAPVFPWIYTGGIDPYLWQPIPGVQSLSFAPYRVDLTPFAGRLSDGRAHEIAVRVHNANDNFASTASVLVYLDHGATRVTGAITENTLDADPTVNVQENVIDGTDPGASTAKISVTASRRYAIAGVARTSMET